MPPRGCTFAPNDEAPYSVSEKTGEACRFVQTSTKTTNPTGKWDLVATKNFVDTTVSIEVGFSSSQKSSTTKEEQQRFFTKVEASASATIVGPAVSKTASLKTTVEY